MAVWLWAVSEALCWCHFTVNGLITACWSALTKNHLWLISASSAGQRSEHEDWRRRRRPPPHQPPDTEAPQPTHVREGNAWVRTCVASGPGSRSAPPEAWKSVYHTRSTKLRKVDKRTPDGGGALWDSLVRVGRVLRFLRRDLSSDVLQFQADASQSPFPCVPLRLPSFTSHLGGDSLRICLESSVKAGEPSMSTLVCSWFLLQDVLPNSDDSQLPLALVVNS